MTTTYPKFFDTQLLEKRQQMIDAGIDPYPYDYDFSHAVSDLVKHGETLLENEEKISTVGRISSARSAGKAYFLDLKKDGARIQLYARQSDLDEESWDILTKYADIGDIIRVEGTLFNTRTGELTINTSKAQMLCKTVVRIPMGKETEDKEYYKAEDPDILYRERYTTWTIKPETKALMEKRFKIINLTRRWMEEQGFMEVQTPTIEMVYGGAEARPFETEIWALQHQKAYMRISPELYLKRYIAGGFDKVFTICQNFRNEGIDKSHNPEFTMMEWYEAATDYNRQMERFENLTEYLVKEMNGGSTKLTYQGQEIDFKTPWKRLSVVDGLKEYADLDVLSMDNDALIKAIEDRGFEYPKGAPRGILIMVLFEELCEDNIIQPTFVMDHPYEISPLTKAKRGLEGFVERFEPVVKGMEIGNAYSEMTDPVIQYQRFMEQRATPNMDGDEDYDSHPVDMDFVKAIGVGMPPTGGVGFGVDRIIMLLTDAPTIKDIIPFPMMKPKD